MRFFRSEETLRQWQAAGNGVGGEVLSLAQLWELSQRWYHNRLSPDFRGRSLGEIEAIFDAVGLTAEFWRYGE
jgi:hypothetical protein